MTDFGLYARIAIQLLYSDICITYYERIVVQLNVIVQTTEIPKVVRYAGEELIQFTFVAFYE